jgi:LmbE family N-acetylglucosaminyl deacetylase
MRLLDDRPTTALAVFAHPDDADVAAGGTIALWARAGVAVHLVVVCDGAKGSHATTAAAPAVKEVRQRELEKAAAVLGVASVRSLGHPDGEVANDAVLRAELVGLVRAIGPEVVLGPDPTATFFGGVYVNHRDHREVGWAVLDAVAPAAAMPLYFPDQGPPHAVETLLLSGTHEPDVVADISSVIATKVEAVLAHASQTGNDTDAVSEVVRARAAQAGRPVGVAFGEAFRCVELAL